MNKQTDRTCRVKSKLIHIALLGLLIAVATRGIAEQPMPTNGSRAYFENPQERIRFDQKLGDTLSTDLQFANEKGEVHAIGSFLSTPSTFLILAYYKCETLCSVVLNGFFQSLETLSLIPGKDYSVVVVSINPKETPDLALAKKATFLKKYGSLANPLGIHFLTGTKEAINQIADQVGFRFAYDETTGDYAHPAGAIVLTKEAKISRYLYGADFPVRDLRLSLVDSSAGKVGSAVDQFLLLCYKYDSAKGGYSFVIHSVLRLLGLITVFGLAIMIYRASRNQPVLRKVAISREELL